MRTREQELMQHYPSIPWCEPQAAIMPGRNGYVCRFCIAMLGIKGTDAHRVQPHDEIVRHIAETHLIHDRVSQLP